MENTNFIQTLEDRGIFLLSSEIETENTDKAIRFILERNIIDVNKLPELKMIINSEGGEMTSAFGLIDIMNASSIPISTHGIGQISSCALMIFMSGKKGRRFISKNTSILSHRYSWGSRGKEHELMARVKEYGLIANRIMEHYKQYSGLSEEDITKYLLPPEDVWLSAEEAVKFGIADAII